MPTAREEDMLEPIPIPIKVFIPAIPRDDKELLELADDLRIMGCEGLLAKPWNLKSEEILREFKFKQGNQWVHTKRRDPDTWTPDVWNRVYGFLTGITEGLASRKDTFYAGKFRGDDDPKEGFHPGNCWSKRERRVLDFLMPILNPEKPKWISLTLANTLFGALSGSRPVNWGLFIHEVVAKALPHIGKKLTFLSPFLYHLYHLYHQYDVLVPDEEDELTIAAKEVTYKLQPEAGERETYSDPNVSDAPSSPGSPQPLPRPDSPLPPPPHPPSPSHPLSPFRPSSPPLTYHPEAGPNGDATWQDVDPSVWDFPANPFQEVQEGLEEVQRQYKRLEHIAQGANQALDNCGPGNIVREIARTANRRELEQTRTELEQVRNENALLQAQVTAMSEELGQKSEKLRRYHAEQ